MDNSAIQYEIFLENIQKDPQLINQLGNVIDMDIARSFKSHPSIPADTLKNILKTYAYYNPQVGYCQGMNYIAGTLFLQFQNQQKTFKSLVHLIENYQMNKLYNQDLAKLKQYFYQLDRLIWMCLPDLHQAFRLSGISSSHFSSSWFITLFAGSFQSRPVGLLRLWDLFLCKGWKIIFQAALAVLEAVQKELLNREFDQMMMVISSFSSPMTQMMIFDQFFIEKLERFPVTKIWLDELEKEYEDLMARAMNREV